MTHLTIYERKFFGAPMTCIFFTFSLLYLKNNRSTELPLVMLVRTEGQVIDSKLDLYTDNDFYAISPNKVGKLPLVNM